MPSIPNATGVLIYGFAECSASNFAINILNSLCRYDIDFTFFTSLRSFSRSILSIVENFWLPSSSIADNYASNSGFFLLYSL